MPKADVLIVGSGIAGLAVAEKAKIHKNVMMLTKQSNKKSNSMLAQGGIAVAISKEDTWQSHIQDTMVAGCFINNEEAVEILVKKGPAYVKEWMEKGLVFDTNAKGELLLGKEGAHERRRILHAGGDQTGFHITSTMLQKVKENVRIIENEMALNLLIQDHTCIGVETRNESGEISRYYADHVVLATGGIGTLYQSTSNDETISGDGLAMAYRAGCQMRDLEFVQFHPTMLYVNGESKGLISEAVRGEGAVLVTASGKRIMENVHQKKDLAPRDIVARAIFSHMQEGENVYLDISMIDHFQKRFPFITELCERNGIDIKGGKIPVAPGAHFHMGGIATNIKGETNIKNLYAVGEVACQGVHGANRLASNSLLEGVVFGSLLGEQLAAKKSLPFSYDEPAERGRVELVLPTKEEIQKVMMEKVGIIRSERLLQEAKQWFESYGVHSNNIQVASLSNEQLIIWNMLTAGWLIAKAALNRKESIGAHYVIREMAKVKG